MNTPETTRCTVHVHCALAADTATVIPAAHEPSETRWRELLKEYLRLKGEFEALPIADTAGLDALYEKFSPMEDQLLAMPAPNLRAVEWKLQYWRRECETFVLEPHHFNALIDDVQRLGD